MAVKPFSVWKLREPMPRSGNVVVCEKCEMRYCPMPNQSHRLCKICQPPTFMCMHLLTIFDPCAACEKMGRGQRFGLRRIACSS